MKQFDEPLILWSIIAVQHGHKEDAIALICLKSPIGMPFYGRVDFGKMCAIDAFPIPIDSDMIMKIWSKLYGE